MQLSSPFDLEMSDPLDGPRPPRPDWPTLDGEPSRPLPDLGPRRPPAHADGLQETRHSNGLCAETWHVARGLRHGPCSARNEAGQVVLEGEWLEGRPHADFERWWPTGMQMVEGAFQHGVPTGTWKITSEDGYVLYEGQWRGTLRSWLPTIFADALAPPRGRAGGR